MTNSRPKVILLDDNRYLSDVISESLEATGISVTSAFDGDQAFKIINQLHLTNQPLDLLITDLYHSGLSGGDLILAIRKLPDNFSMQGGLKIRNLPIIVATALSEAKSTIPAIDKRIPVLIKPYQPNELLDTIDRTLRDYRRRILEDMQQVGLGIKFDGGIFRLCHCYSIQKENTTSSQYISIPEASNKNLNPYTRLVLIEDRYWSAQRAIQEFEDLLNSKSSTERNFQEFFCLHPEFWLITRKRTFELKEVDTPAFLNLAKENRKESGHVHESIVSRVWNQGLPARTHRVSRG